MLKKLYICGLLITLTLAIPVIWYLYPREVNFSIDDNIDYQRSIVKSIDGKAVLHAVSMGVNSSTYQVFITPFDMDGHYKARTTSEFGDEFSPLVAINASFFTPFRERRPWDFYPQSGQTIRPIGLTIANGQRLRLYGDNFVTLCFGPDSIDITKLTCPANTMTAVSGDSHFLKDGQMELNKKKLNTKPYPRSVIGFNTDKTKMWFITVEGKQPGRSNGLTLATLADILIGYGISDAINLDGGGSATLAAQINGKMKVLSSPIHTRIPFRQRPVANHVGIKRLENSPQ